MRKKGEVKTPFRSYVISTKLAKKRRKKRGIVEGERA